MSEWKGAARTAAATAGILAGFALCAGVACATEGIDVSEWQGSINWGAVAQSGRSFAIARVSYGAYYIDPYFAANWNGIKAAGMVRGVYQFFLPSQDGATQAQVLLNHIGNLGPGDLPPVCDLEVRDGCSDARIMQQLGAWCATIRNAIGREPLIYTSPGFWNGIGGHNTFGADLWVAHWFVSSPWIPAGWGNWQVWQYSDAGSVPGISGRVDLDRFNGSVADLRNYARSTPPYAAQLAGVNIPATLYSGQSASCWIDYQNVGTSGWDGNTHLGTSDPRDHTSALACGSWLGPNRPCSVQAATGPGGTGRFPFTIVAPQVSQPTTVTESFRLVQEWVTWFGAPDTLVHFSVNIVPLDYAGEITGQSFPAVLDEGQSATCWVEYRNKGQKAWDASTRLGTTDPPDHPSVLVTPGKWVNPARATAVDAATARGAVGRFTFTITAPPVASGTQTFTEKFRLVQEGVTWFPAQPDTLVTLAVAVRHVPKPGNIEVVSDPPGAAVFLSGNAGYAGRFVGLTGPSATALVIPKLPPLRRYHLRISTPGRAAQDAFADVPDNGTVRVSATLPWKPIETWSTDAPLAAAGQKIHAPGGYAAPFLVDWNEDGNLDLVLGAGDGSVDVFLGGSAAKLDLAAPVAAQTIAGPVTVGARAVPFVVDWNGDDEKDLIVGAASGKVFIFLNVRDDADPLFAAPVALQVGGKDFVAPGGDASPWVVDWDGDGKKDLLVGAGDGSVLLLRNTGTDAAPVFAAAVQVAIDQKGPIAVGNDAQPSAADWNNDGRFDLAVGSKTEDVALLRSSGTAVAPLFAPPGQSALRYYYQDRQIAVPAPAGRFLLVDTNGDGLRDLVIGLGSGDLTIALGVHLDGDVDDSKKVDGHDLAKLLRALGAKKGDALYSPALDLNGDGAIDAKDVKILEANFGRTY